MAEKGTAEEKEKVLGMCLCPGCPSWQECGERGGFCLSLVGLSKCIKRKEGCMCGGCPAHSMLGFRNYYYCIDGPEKSRK